MRQLTAVVLAIVLTVVAGTPVVAQTRDDRTVQTEQFNDLEFDLPEGVYHLSVELYWENSNVIVDDLTLLCLDGPDDLTLAPSRTNVHVLQPRRAVWTTTIGMGPTLTSYTSRHCWITIDLESKDGYDVREDTRVVTQMNVSGATFRTALSSDLSAVDQARIEAKRDAIRQIRAIRHAVR